MTSALLDSPLSLLAESGRARPAGGRGVTLEERLEATLRAVRADGQAECPVCRRPGMRALGEAARCADCGSTLI